MAVLGISWREFDKKLELVCRGKKEKFGIIESFVIKKNATLLPIFS